MLPSIGCVPLCRSFGRHFFLEADLSEKLSAELACPAWSIKATKKSDAEVAPLDMLPQMHTIEFTPTTPLKKMDKGKLKSLGQKSLNVDVYVPYLCPNATYFQMLKEASAKVPFRLEGHVKLSRSFSAVDENLKSMAMELKKVLKELKATSTPKKGKDKDSSRKQLTYKYILM